jgi:hypothetical protein
VSRSAGSLRGALAWGILWAVIGGLALYLIAPNPWQIQGSRAIEMQAALSVLEHGGPALLGYAPGTHAPYAIGYSDDQGIYVIVPQLSYWLGQTNTTSVLRWLWVLAWTATLLSSTLVFRSLFRSRWAWLLAPPTLLVCIVSFGFGDIYWVSAWEVVTFLPPLILLARARPRSQWLALVAIALIAGVVTAVRSEAGLPIALAAVAVAIAVVARARWPLRIVLVAAIAFAYLAPTSILMPAIREHRDHRIGVDLSAEEPTSHPLWHSLYIGLGYTSNRFGIHYLDAYGGAAAQESDPGVRFLSPAYSTALRKQVDALIAHDPGFVAREEGEKVFVEVFLAVPYLLLLALLLPGALSARGPARLRAFELALFAPALVIGAVSPILAIPIRSYEQTLLAALGTIGLLAIGSAATRAQERWPLAARASGDFARRWPRSARWRRLSPELLWEILPRRATLRALLVAVVILVPTSLFARHLEAAHARWDSEERSPARVVLAAVAVGAARTRDA